MYDGETPDNDWWTNVATLKWMRWRTGSQCSRRGATENAGVENAIRAKMQGWKMQEYSCMESLT